MDRELSDYDRLLTFCTQRREGFGLGVVRCSTVLQAEAAIASLATDTFASGREAAVVDLRNLASDSTILESLMAAANASRGPDVILVAHCDYLLINSRLEVLGTQAVHDLVQHRDALPSNIPCRVVFFVSQPAHDAMLQIASHLLDVALLSANLEEKFARFPSTRPTMRVVGHPSVPTIDAIRLATTEAGMQAESMRDSRLDWQSRIAAGLAALGALRTLERDEEFSLVAKELLVFMQVLLQVHPGEDRDSPPKEIIFAYRALVHVEVGALLDYRGKSADALSHLERAAELALMDDLHLAVPELARILCRAGRAKEIDAHFLRKTSVPPDKLAYGLLLEGVAPAIHEMMIDKSDDQAPEGEALAAPPIPSSLEGFLEKATLPRLSEPMLDEFVREHVGMVMIEMILVAVEVQMLRGVFDARARRQLYPIIAELHALAQVSPEHAMMLGAWYESEGYPYAAIQCYILALDASEDASDDGGVQERIDFLRVRTGLSSPVSDVQRTDLEAILVKIECLREQRNAHALAFALRDLGIEQESRGNIVEALRARTEELSLHENALDLFEVAVTRFAIAKLNLAEGNADEAVRLSRSAQGAFEQLGDHGSALTCAACIVDIHCARRASSVVLKKAQKSERRLALATGDRVSLARCDVRHAEQWMALGHIVNRERVVSAAAVARSSADFLLRTRAESLLRRPDDAGAATGELVAYYLRVLSVLRE